MYPTTDAFLAEIHKDHTVDAYAEFWFQGVLKTTLPILSGQVTEDSTAAIRRRCTLVFSGGTEGLDLPDAKWSASDPSPFWPTGWEVKVWAGFIYADGTSEYVPCGVYRISKPKISVSSADFQISIDGYDRSRQVSRARFTDLYWIAGGTDYATAIKTILQDRMPSLHDENFKFMATDGSDGGYTYTTPWMVFVPLDDPWEKVTDMAKSIGAELFFDGNGDATLRPIPDPLFTPSMFDYAEGEANVLTALNRGLDDERAYNGVIAQGQNNDNYYMIPRGEAWDVNPGSPTYYDPTNPVASTYGAVPYFYTSDYITTNAQALATAQALLNGVMGILESVDFTAVSNPAHEAGDVIALQESRANVDEVYVLESYQFALGAQGSTSGTTRKRRVS